MDPITLALLSVAGSVLKDAVGDFAAEVLRDLAKDLCKEQTRSLAGRLAGACKAVLLRTAKGKAALNRAETVAEISPEAAEALLTPAMQEQAAELRNHPDLVSGLHTLLAELRALPKDILAPPVILPALPPGETAPLQAGERQLETRLEHPAPAPGNGPQRYQTRLTFTTRLTPFRGRNVEFDRLKAFAADDAPFRWWLVTGNGGAGKSRLAQELCLTLAEQGWRTGFLRGTPDPLVDALIANGGRISGEAPVLLVVDYCDPHAAALRRLIACLHARRGDTLPPVRLLLLERAADQPWYETTLTGPSDERPAVEASRHDAPLALPDYDAEQAWAMAEGYISAVAALAGIRAATVEKDTFLTHARDADPAFRPLTVLLLADGPAHGLALGSGTPASLGTLLEDHLHRLETRFWGDVDEQHRTLLCAATLFRGLPVSLLAKPWPDLEQDLPYGRDYDPAQYRRLSGTESREVLAPLQPDLLGEYYVLETLYRRSTAAFSLRTALLAARREPLCQAGAIQFAHLCTRDFAGVTAPSRSGMLPAQAAADLLLAIEPDGTDLIALKAAMIADAIAYFGKAKSIPLCEALLNVLKNIQTAHSDQTELHLQWARGAVNMIIAHGSGTDLTEAEALLRALDEARNRNPNDKEIRLRWVQAALAMTRNYIISRNVIKIKSILVKMNSLTINHQEDSELCLLRAQGEGNLAVAYANTGNLSEALSCLDAILSTPGLPEEFLSQAQEARQILQLPSGGQGA